MKLSVMDKENKEVGKIDLPPVFDTPVREDIIKRAVEAIDSANRQPYGADPEAGKKHSTWMSRRRRAYRGSYGFGISRIPRKIMSRRGRRLNWVGAFSPGTRGGRRAHPPKATKKIIRKINKKERRLAIRSALSATLSKEWAARRGHKVPGSYPFVIDTSFEGMKKTAELRKSLVAMGFADELKRTDSKKIRAGKGKARGRKYKTKTGPLVVASEECSLLKAAGNLPGVETAVVKNINSRMLAPGAVPGRLTLFTKKAIEAMKEESLFMEK